MGRMETALSGKKTIMKYVGRSWGTLMGWKDKQGFPMAKIGDRWESDIELIQEWRKGQIRKN
jgi:hypothetical protein